MSTTAPSLVAVSPLRIGARRFFTGPIGYVAVLVVAVVALWAGSGSRPQSLDAARIAHLESIIRCPSCADLSIADSETTSAQGLRGEVTRLVHQGLPDQTIESRVEAEFPGTLLIPSGEAGVAVFLIPGVVIVGGALTFALLLFKRRNRSVVADNEADLALVRAAQQSRREGP